MKKMASRIRECQKQKYSLHLQEDSKQLYGDVSTLIIASFAFNSSLVGFLAHTRFLKLISTKQASDAMKRKPTRVHKHECADCSTPCALWPETHAPPPLSMAPARQSE